MGRGVQSSKFKVQGRNKIKDKSHKTKVKSRKKEKGKSQEDKAPHLGGWGVKRQRFKVRTPHAASLFNK